MKRLLLGLTLLCSSATYAGVGDVYYCVTDNITQVSKSHNERFNNQKFKFQWTETEIVYSGGYFDGIRETLVKSWPDVGKFRSKSASWEEITVFENGKLRVASHSPGEAKITVIIATCDKF